MARNNKILLRKKGDAAGAPSAGDLEYGELVINYNSGSKKLYFKDSGDSVREFIDSVQVQTKADTAQSNAVADATALAIALGWCMANTFKLKSANNLTTSLATKYTVPSSTTAVVLSISFANTSNASKTVDIQIISDTDSNANAYLGKSLPVPAGGTLEIMQGNKLVLQTTDAIKAKASAGSSVDILISVMEIT